jgi:uncharacterized protein YbjT (DUF2867 family)
MILVTGATGNAGGAVVSALQDRGEAVRGLVRSPTVTLPGAAEAVVGDLDRPETLAGPLAGARGLFLLPGYRDMPGVLAQASAAGVERVVLLSGGAAAAAYVENPISQYMLRSEEAVRTADLAWTILRPYEFMSNALRWAAQVRAGDVVRAPFADVGVAVIDPRDIAAVAAAALLEDGHAGKTYRLSGPQALLPAERVHLLGAAVGRELRFEGQSDAEARAEMSATMPPDYVDAFIGFYTDGWVPESDVLSTVEEVTGRQPRTFARWAADHADAFR